jgi:hypothetical protein
MKYLTFILLTTIIVSCKSSKSAECDAYGELLNDYLNISEKYTECQIENSTMLDEIIRLEEENQILGSYAASQAIKD